MASDMSHLSSQVTSGSRNPRATCSSEKYHRCDDNFLAADELSSNPVQHPTFGSPILTKLGGLNDHLLNDTDKAFESISGHISSFSLVLISL